MAQFYVDDIDLDGQEEIPIDNFYWMTDEGKKIRLVMHAGDVFLEVPGDVFLEVSTEEKLLPCKDVPDGLRLMARTLEVDLRLAHSVSKTQEKRKRE